MNVGMYLRKSRSEETTDTVEQTLSRHKEILTEFAFKNNLVVDQIYEEVYTGDSLYCRPEMLRLLADVEKGQYDAVLCMDIDRLGRGGMSEQGVILDTLKYSDTKIITPRKVYDLNNELDEEYTEFETFMARRELKLIKRRLHRGIQKTIQDGGYIANAPYGYEKTTVNKQPTLKIIEEEAAFVRMIFDLYVNQGYGCSIIADTISGMGAKPHRANRFSRTSILKILKNNVYIGKIVWNQKQHIRKGIKGNEKDVVIYNPPEKWTTVQGIHPPIIEESLFHAAQEILQGRYHPPSFNGTVKNPLSGILQCKNCGNLMQRQLIRGGEYLFCQTKGCMTSSKLCLVEESVIDSLNSHLTRLPLKAGEEKENHSNGDFEQILNTARSQLQTTQNQLDKLHDFLEQGVYTIDVFLSRQNILREKMHSIQKSMEEIEEKQSQNKRIDYERIKRQLQYVLGNYPSADPQRKNTLLKSIIQSGVYYKEKGQRLSGFEVDLELKKFYM